MAAEPVGGDWGAAMDVIFCIFPLAFLVITTLVKAVRVPTSKSLPLAAAFMWVIRLGYLKSDPNYTNAALMYGMFDAITPMSISAGAILLFAAMEATQCMPWCMIRLKSLSQGHPVAEVFLILWAFEYLIEGASGFGTPVALAAPMMGQLGHDPFRVVVTALIMNTLATPFGGVGTPIWFGFSGLFTLEEEPDKFQEIAWKVQLIMSILAHFLPVVAASFLVPYKVLARNWLFILLSIWSCVIPAMAMSFVSYEFPSLLGGLVGVAITSVLSKFKIGLHDDLSGMAAVVLAGEAEGAEHPTSSMELGIPALPENATAAEKEAWEATRASIIMEKRRSLFEESGAITSQGLDFLRALDSEGAVARAERMHDKITQTHYTMMTDASGAGVLVPAGSGVSGCEGSIRLTQAIAYMPSAELPVFSSTLVADAQGKPRTLEEAVDEALEAITVENAPSATPEASLKAMPLSVSEDDTSKDAATQSMNGVSIDNLAMEFDTSGWSWANRTNPADMSLKSLPPVNVQTPINEGDKVVVATRRPHAKRMKHLNAQRGKREERQEEGNWIMTAIWRTFPLWGTVLLLIITRVPAIGIKDELRKKEPYFELVFNSLFVFRLSASLVIQFRDMLTTNVAWSYDVLYVPCILPFVVVSSLAVYIFRKDIRTSNQRWIDPYKLTANRVSYIVVPLIGALSLVSLIRKAPTSQESPAYIVGYELSSALSEGWLAIVCFNGALGSFFSGSTTTSNLTFGMVNAIAAKNLNFNTTTLLAMQCVGGTLGNMICINNIISAKTVMGLIKIQEGKFISSTAGPIAIALVAGSLLGTVFIYSL